MGNSKQYIHYLKHSGVAEAYYTYSYLSNTSWLFTITANYTITPPSINCDTINAIQLANQIYNFIFYSIFVNTHKGLPIGNYNSYCNHNSFDRCELVTSILVDYIIIERNKYPTYTSFIEDFIPFTNTVISKTLNTIMQDHFQCITPYYTLPNYKFSITPITKNSYSLSVSLIVKEVSSEIEKYRNSYPVYYEVQ